MSAKTCKQHRSQHLVDLPRAREPPWSLVFQIPGPLRINSLLTYVIIQSMVVIFPLNVLMYLFFISCLTVYLACYIEAQVPFMELNLVNFAY